MLTYQFLTKREKRKTHWQIPMWRKSYYPILDKTFYEDACCVIGREHWIIEQHSGVAPLGVPTPAPIAKLIWSTTTEYNAAGQVIREVDQNGRIVKTLYNDFGQIISVQSLEGTVSYEYDLWGRQTRVYTEKGDDIRYGYDQLGRLQSVTSEGKTTYGYDSNGIRVSAIHEVNGKITKTEYLNDSQSLTVYSQVLRQTEFDIEGNIIKTISYIIGHQRISQIVIENGTEQEYYFTFDGHDSTRALLDFINTIIQLYSFDAYGNALGFDPSLSLTEFLYSGEQFDSKIGQQYLRARYYDPTTGRFNRFDPFFGNLDNPQSLHKYLYTHADPVNGIDPSGNSWARMPIMVGLYVYKKEENQWTKMVIFITNR